MIVSLVDRDHRHAARVLRPAFRATRVPPIAAVREGSVLPPSAVRPLRRRAVVASSVCRDPRLARRRASRRLRSARGLDAPVMRLASCSRLASLAPVHRRRDGRAACVYPIRSPLIARPSRASRRPRRRRRPRARCERRCATPSRPRWTAAALMIGLALVTFVAVLAQGSSRVRERGQAAVQRRLRADVPERLHADRRSTRWRRCASSRGDHGVAGVRAGRRRGRSASSSTSTAVDPGISQMISIDVEGRLDSIARRRSARRARSSTRPSRRSTTSRSARRSSSRRPTARRSTCGQRRSSTPPQGGSPFGSVTISAATFDSNFPNPQNVFTLVNIARRRHAGEHGAARQRARRPSPTRRSRRRSSSSTTRSRASTSC